MNGKMTVFYGIFLLVSGLSSAAPADTGRDIAIDRAVGGMEEGSRILAPESYGKETVPEVSGTTLSPATDAKVISSAPEAGKAAAIPVTTDGIAAGGASPASGPLDVGAGGSGGASTEVDTNVNPDTGTGGIGTETGPGTGGEISGESSTPVIDVDASADLDSGTVDTSAGVDTSGGQLLDADLSGAGTDATVDAGTTDTTEPSGDSGSAIIDVDAGADLDSGTVDAGIGVDTSGDQLLETDVAATDTDSTSTIEADIGSAPDITSVDTTVIPESVSTTTTQPLLDAQIDTTGETTGGTTDVGVEADVSGTGAGEDVVADPADGTSLGI